MAKAKKPAKKKKSAKAKPKKQKRKPKQPYRLLGDYFEGLAANQRSFGLERALEMMIDMYQYEPDLELDRLQKEARAVIDGGLLGQIVELARQKQVTELDATQLQAILKQIVEAERYIGAEE